MVYYFSSICLLLVFNAYQLQVSALLEETTIAIDTGHKLMSELEKRTNYTNAKDLIYDLKRLTEIYCNYMNKRERLPRVNFVIHSDTFIDLGQLLSNDNGIGFHQKCRYFSSLFDDSQIANITAEFGLNMFESNILIKDSIHENDYNLKGDMVWGDALNKMHKLITTAEEDGGQSLLGLLTNETEGAKCNHRMSRQQLFFYQLYKIVAIDGKAYTTMQYAYAYYETILKAHNVIQEDHSVIESFKAESALWKEKNLIKKMKTLEKEFLERNTNTANAFKAHMNVSRNLWNCNIEDGKKNEGGYYGRKVSKVTIQAFQKYVINEADLNSGGSCKQNCPYYKQSKVFGCYDKYEICGQQRQCEGNLWDCQKISSSAADICLTDNEDLWERYQYVEISGKQYGKRKYTCRMVHVKDWPRFLYKCDYCMCTCESKRSNDDRHFNLRPVISDTNYNYVVTGARFQMHNHIMHIQIQQGRLVENGRINGTQYTLVEDIREPEWKPIDNYTVNDENVIAGKDYYAVSRDDRIVCLDELDSPNTSHVVTGLRFKAESENNLYLKLEIRLTPFDYKTGRLSDKDSYWYSNSAKLRDRGEVNLEKLEATNLKSDKYFRFTASPLEVDAGQITIPYIDTADVKSYIPVPLSGAGLFLAKNYTLGIKALTYDFQSKI